MALPVSVSEMIDLGKYAYKLWSSCKAARSEFDQVGREVFAMRTVIELASVNCQDPYIIKLAGGKQETFWRHLGIHISNCKQALKDVDAVLKRYKSMSLLDRVAWALQGRAELADLESNLSSFATQLDSFVTGLILKGVGMVNAKLSLLQCGLGRIEEELEKNNGNDAAAVKNIMRDARSSGISHHTANNYSRIFNDYAEEMRRSDPSPNVRRAPTPDPPGKRNHNVSTLVVPTSVHRSRSTGAPHRGKDTQPAQSPFNISPSGNKPKFSLECWLIQIKSAEALFLTFKRNIKEKQMRGQWKLEQMAKQFRSASQASKLPNTHNLVTWVLEDRKKSEEDPKYTWYPYSAKIERKNSLFLGLGIEEQAMVIIKRQMTPEAQKKADEEARIEAEKLAALKRQKAENAKKEAAEQKAARAILARKIKDEMEQQQKIDKGNGKSKGKGNGTGPRSTNQADGGNKKQEHSGKETQTPKEKKKEKEPQVETQGAAGPQPSKMHKPKSNPKKVGPSPANSSVGSAT